MKKKKGIHSGSIRRVAPRQKSIRSERPLAPAAKALENTHENIISIPKRFGPAADEEME